MKETTVEQWKNDTWYVENNEGKGTREHMETINENNEQERTKNKNDNEKG